MSDFGTAATVHRADQEATSASDEELIKQIVKELTYPLNTRINDFAAFDIRFGGSSRQSGGDGILVTLTEYWFGDDEGSDGLSDDALSARDTPLAEQFGDALQSRLGDGYEVEIYCGHW